MNLITMANTNQKTKIKTSAKTNNKQGKTQSAINLHNQKDEKKIYEKYLKTNNKLLEKKIAVMEKQILLLCIINSKLDLLKQMEKHN